MVSTLYSGSRGPGLSPCRVIVLCSWARHFTLYPGMGTSKLSGKPDEMLEGYLTILLVASCYGNRDKLRQ